MDSVLLTKFEQFVIILEQKWVKIRYFLLKNSYDIMCPKKYTFLDKNEDKNGSIL